MQGSQRSGATIGIRGPTSPFHPGYDFGGLSGAGFGCPGSLGVWYTALQVPIRDWRRPEVGIWWWYRWGAGYEP